MTKFIKKIILVFKYNDELETILKQMKDEEEEKRRLARLKNLDLCFEHRQEVYHSHYSKYNCDYCKLENELRILKNK